MDTKGLMPQKVAKRGIGLTTFYQLPIGGRFEFRGRRYEKMNSEVGRDEERGGNLFHAKTEVLQMQNAEWRVKNGKSTSPPPAGVQKVRSGEARKSAIGGQKSNEGHLTPALSPRGGEGEQRRPAHWWLPRMRELNEKSPAEADRSELEARYENGANSVPVETNYWRRPARRATRLGREPDRELRAYGTL